MRAGGRNTPLRIRSDRLLPACRDYGHVGQRDLPAAIVNEADVNRPVRAAHPA